MASTTSYPSAPPGMLSRVTDLQSLVGDILSSVNRVSSKAFDTRCRVFGFPAEVPPPQGNISEVKPDCVLTVLEQIHSGLSVTEAHLDYFLDH